MDSKKRKFIIDNFGCKTQIGEVWVLTSLANSSTVSAEEFWNVFSGDAENFFDIRKTQNEQELFLTLDYTVRKYIEREIEFDNIAKMDVGFGCKWVNNSLRCYLEDTNHNKKFIPFIFILNDEAVRWRGFVNTLNTSIIDKANLFPVNSGSTAIIPENHGGYIVKGGKFGCINKIGRVQVPLIYDDVIVFTNPFLAIAEKDGKKFLINKWGEHIAHNFDELVRFYGDFCIAKKNGKYGIIDYELNVVVPFDYEKILCRPYTYNKAILYIGSHCGLYDLHERKFLVDIAYDTIVEHREAKDIFSVSINNKWGIIDDSNLVVVSIEYEYIASLNNIGLVKKNGKYGVLDKDIRCDNRSWEWKDFSLNECIPCVYDEVYNTNGDVSHTQSFFYCYRCYFAKYHGNEVKLDCYTTVCHRKNGCADYLTREILTSLNCKYDNIKDTIIDYDKTQSNITKVIHE